MTAPPGARGSGEPTDADLVARVLDADRDAFAQVYDRYGNRLFDFAYSMLRHREDAADAVADAFLIFAERLGQLRDPDRLRPWLYAIVRSECLARLKARKRVSYGDEDQLVAMPDESISPERAAEQAALRDLVWAAAAGLADRDRALLDLHLRQGLDGAELGEAMGVSASNAYVMLNRLRGQVDRSLGALLIARLGRDDCDELAAVLADWDGGFSPLIRKRVARHVDKCEVCSERRKRMVSPWVLLGTVPMFAAPAGLRDRVLEDTRLVAHAGSAARGDVTLAAAGTGGGRWSRSWTALSALAAALLILLTVLVWPRADGQTPALEAKTASPSVVPTSAAPSPSAAATTEAPTPTPSTSPSPTVSEEPEAGALTVSTRSIDLGRSATRATFSLSNTGDLPVVYQLSSRARWLAVGPSDGRLGGGSTLRVGLDADRSALPEGRATARVVVTWDGGSATIRVSLDQDRAPAVGAPRTTGASTCTASGRLVTVTAVVTDESRLSSVRISWTGPSGSDSGAMSRVSSGWTAEVGPFPVGGSLTMRVTATDARGNTTTGPATTTSVDPCPQ